VSSRFPSKKTHVSDDIPSSHLSKQIQLTPYFFPAPMASPRLPKRNLRRNIPNSQKQRQTTLQPGTSPIHTTRHLHEPKPPPRPLRIPHPRLARPLRNRHHQLQHLRAPRSLFSRLSKSGCSWHLS
jgi:hypothetical protein